MLGPTLWLCFKLLNLRCLIMAETHFTFLKEVNQNSIIITNYFVYAVINDCLNVKNC